MIGVFDTVINVALFGLSMSRFNYIVLTACGVIAANKSRRQVEKNEENFHIELFRHNKSLPAACLPVNAPVRTKRDH